ncbi:class I SAM-dependent DNA methyltransferase [Cereibacter changlensis]|uniref:site-specific DNA-methyltransferase (adenine-specific) n=1 Tax=Cereibacter changlensis TaxID=402884 RepID=A0A4U0YWN7_9RHOB|nr:DNA methyltransferase [Cereibacter changlensis]TKA96225.1 class I SAM-dependent DNA methyltransferase [Cereibacter changlensis]
MERLLAFRVLDPACGSGNFLYIALLELKNFEHLVNLEAEALGFPREFPRVGPESVLGIELNPYAAELARVSVWIGEIQWMRRNGFEAAKNPILRTLDTIQCRDAILDADGRIALWPKADAIVGNPPFLGAKSMNRKLGRMETQRLREAYSDRLPGFTDLVCYWFERAREEIVLGNATRAGFVATKSIAKNTNLPVLHRICERLKIFNAWSNEPWVIDGAAVRVSLVCFCGPEDVPDELHLNALPVSSINADLTSGLDKTSVKPLRQNRDVSFVGVQKSGPFDVDGDLARQWLKAPSNPNGFHNSHILRPTVNGSAITAGSKEVWLIDFPRGLTVDEASLWERPFEYLSRALYDSDSPELGLLKDFRKGVRDWQPREEWWTTYWPRPDLRAKLAQLTRYIATPMTSEHRVFVWLALPLIPDNNTVVFARDDDAFFGIIHSSFHEAWSTLLGNRMGAGNQRRYNAATIFETFPFPEGLSPDTPASTYAGNPRATKIAAAASKLSELREKWLRPPELVRSVPEVVDGYPARLLPVSEAATAALRERTLTNLYNLRPAWLSKAHTALDEAVAEAYGWGDDWRAGLLNDDEILARLFGLNQERSKERPS